jgi:cytidine deaminase
VTGFIDSRFPSEERGAAGVLLGDGTVLTSTSPDSYNSGAHLCHEVGAYCEAFKVDQPILASLCLHREPGTAPLVLSPCGICLERLAVHGAGVLVGVPSAELPTEVRWVTLRDAHPYYWRTVFSEDTPNW